MIRSFMMLLILVVVFLSGMLFGVEKGQYILTDSVEEQDSEAKERQSKEEINSAEKKETEKKHNKDSKSTHETQHSDVINNEYFTHKTASFLEKGVKGFYNIIVEVMYQFSKIFF